MLQLQLITVMFIVWCSCWKCYLAAHIFLSKSSASLTENVGILLHDMDIKVPPKRNKAQRSAERCQAECSVRQSTWLSDRNGHWVDDMLSDTIPHFAASAHRW